MIINFAGPKLDAKDKSLFSNIHSLLGKFKVSKNTLDTYLKEAVSKTVDGTVKNWIDDSESLFADLVKAGYEFYEIVTMMDEVADNSKTLTPLAALNAKKAKAIEKQDADNFQSEKAALETKEKTSTKREKNKTPHDDDNAENVDPLSKKPKTGDDDVINSLIRSLLFNFSKTLFSTVSE